MANRREGKGRSADVIDWLKSVTVGESIVQVII